MKIYICKVSQLFQQYTGQEIYEQIPQERRRSARACKNEADRRRSLAVSFLLGQCMRACRIPSDARIAYTKSGKLYFPDLDRFYVNLSHAGDYAVCAYDKEEIGVDVEAVRTYQERVAARLATDPEKQYFDRCTDKERDIAFSKWWTKKECAVKLTGMGIAVFLVVCYCQHLCPYSKKQTCRFDCSLCCFRNLFHTYNKPQH